MGPWTGAATAFKPDVFLFVQCVAPFASFLEFGQQLVVVRDGVLRV